MQVQISKQIKDKLAYAALNRLRRKLSSTSQSVGVENVLYVSKDGDDATAVPGSLVNKYDTVQGAVNAAAALPYGVVLVGPGVYPESVVVPDGAQNMIIVGEDQYACSIEAPAGSPAILVAPTQTLGLLSIENIALVGNLSGGAGAVLQVDGSAVPGGAIFANGAGSIRDVLVINAGTDPAASFVSCSNLNLQDDNFDSNQPGPGAYYTTTFSECNGDVVTCELDRTLIGWSTAGVLPAGGSNRLLVRECRGALAVTGLARVQLLGGYYQGSQILVYPALLLQATDDATYTGQVIADGTNFDWDVILGANYNNVAAPPTADQSDFCNCSFAHDVTVNNNGGPGSVRHGPRMKSCVLDRTITANNGCDVDIRGSAFEQGGLAYTGDGTIDRTETILRNLQISGAPGVYTPITVPFVNPIAALGGAPLPAYAANLYSVLVEPHTLDASCTWNIDPTGKTGLTFAAQAFVGGVPDAFDADVTLIRR
jgi:hypothetical protein